MLFAHLCKHYNKNFKIYLYLLLASLEKSSVNLVRLLLVIIYRFACGFGLIISLDQVASLVNINLTFNMLDGSRTRSCCL